MILLAIPTVKLVFRYSVINKERYILILLLYSKTLLSYMKKLKLIFLYALPALMLYVLRFMKGGDQTQISGVKSPARGSDSGETLYSFSDP